MDRKCPIEESVPACETRLQSLRCELEAYKQTVTSKRTNSVILDKLTRALLQEMDIHDDDYLPRSSLSLYSKGIISKCFFL